MICKDYFWPRIRVSCIQNQPEASLSKTHFTGVQTNQVQRTSLLSGLSTGGGTSQCPMQLLRKQDTNRSRLTQGSRDPGLCCTGSPEPALGRGGQEGTQEGTEAASQAWSGLPGASNARPASERSEGQIETVVPLLTPSTRTHTNGVAAGLRSDSRSSSPGCG